MQVGTWEILYRYLYILWKVQNRKDNAHKIISLQVPSTQIHYKKECTLFCTYINKICCKKPSSKISSKGIGEF